MWGCLSINWPETGTNQVTVENSRQSTNGDGQRTQGGISISPSLPKGCGQWKSRKLPMSSLTWMYQSLVEEEVPVATSLLP